MRKMSHRWSLLLVIAIIGCTASTPPIQPNHNYSTAIRDTIDFGTVPLWRKADTVIKLKLSSNPLSLADSISGLNFFRYDSLRRSPDSTVTIPLRYQPESVMPHQGTLALLSGKDTLALIALMGNTSPFERHVGDSYVFVDDSGKLDSVWVSSLPLTFSSTGKDEADQIYRSIVMKQDSNWVAQLNTPFAANSTQAILPIRSLDSSGTSWQGTFDTDYRFPTQGTWQIYNESSSAIPKDTNELVGNLHLSLDKIILGYHYFCKGRFVMLIMSEQYNWEYSPEIGFFVTLSEVLSNENQQYGQDEKIDASKTYRLVRFHLRH